MRLSLKLFISFSIVFLFGFLSTKSALAVNYTLSGKVSDNSGTAIVGATVNVNDATSDSTTTDNSGNYSLSIPQGTYNVKVTPHAGSNFSSAIALSQNISANTVLNFILTAAGGTVTLNGHIYDSLGNPVSNQIVDLYLNGSQFRATTDSTGNYSLSVSTGTYELEIFPNSTNTLPINVPTVIFY